MREIHDKDQGLASTSRKTEIVNNLAFTTIPGSTIMLALTINQYLETSRTEGKFIVFSHILLLQCLLLPDVLRFLRHFCLEKFLLAVLLG